MKKCNVCGKNYSDAYDACPYCSGQAGNETVRVLEPEGYDEGRNGETIRIENMDDRGNRVEHPEMPAGTRLTLGILIGVLAGALIALVIMLLLNRGSQEPAPVPVVQSGIGSVDGLVCEAEDTATPVGNAAIEMYTATGNDLYTTRNSGEDGTFDFPVPADRYLMVVSEPEHIEFTAYPTIASDEPMHMGTILLIRGAEGDEGGASGTINDATTGRPVADARVDFLKGWYAFFPGVTDLDSEAVGRTTTDEAGAYSIHLPIGNYTAVVSGDGLVSNPFNIIVKNGETEHQNGTAQPMVDVNTDAVNDYLITLTWGATPSDLDSHLRGKHANGSSYHVYFSDKRSDYGGVTVCNLDVDDTTSYGPEHVTLSTETAEPYYFYVHRYSSSGSLAASGATVTIHRNNELVRTFNVPTNGGSGIYWNVFAIKNGQIIVKDDITDSPNLEYAN